MLERLTSGSYGPFSSILYMTSIKSMILFSSGPLLFIALRIIASSWPNCLHCSNIATGITIHSSCPNETSQHFANSKYLSFHQWLKILIIVKLPDWWNFCQFFLIFTIYNMIEQLTVSYDVYFLFISKMV